MWDTMYNIYILTKLHNYDFLLCNNTIKGIRGGHTQGKGIGGQNLAKTQQTEKASKAHSKPPTESAGPNVAMTNQLHITLAMATDTEKQKPEAKGSSNSAREGQDHTKATGAAMIPTGNTKDLWYK